MNLLFDRVLAQRLGTHKSGCRSRTARSNRESDECFQYRRLLPHQFPMALIGDGRLDHKINVA